MREDASRMNTAAMVVGWKPWPLVDFLPMKNLSKIGTGEGGSARFGRILKPVSTFNVRVTIHLEDGSKESFDSVGAMMDAGWQVD